MGIEYLLQFPMVEVESPTEQGNARIRGMG